MRKRFPVHFAGRRLWQRIGTTLAVAAVLALAGCSGSSTQSTTDNSSPTDASKPAKRAAEKAPPPPPVVIDAGTVLTVTIDQTVGTATNDSGDKFAASLAEPVTVNAREILPVGTKLSGTVVQAQSAGRVKGSAVLALTLDSVSVNGQSYQIQTSEFEEQGKGRGKRTGIGAGGGAAFGAIVGALAGGGKGAAIGALAGGGAGTAGAAFTGKRDFTIPAETRLHFKLKEPLSIPSK